MKISKLFHWLYAIVMLLPIFAIGITCGYVMFNKNAYKNYSGEETIETTYIHSTNDFKVNEQYIFNSNSYTSLENVVNGGNQARIVFSNVEIISTSFTFDLSTLSQIGFYKTSTNNYAIYLYDNLGNSLGSGNNSTNYLTFSGYYISNNLFPSWVSETNLFYKTTNQSNNYIDNIFYYSVDKVTQSNMFNWAYDSFLVAPFSYIVNLFSMPINSPVVMLLSYWLSISIIWLTFDLVMYVPLLVHRWLDKGVLE